MTLFDPFPILETPRLRLRALVPGDLDVMHRLQSDPEVTRYFGRGPLTREQAKERVDQAIEGVRAGTSIRWGLTLPGTDELAGTAALWRWNKEHRWAEIGYELAPEHWGKGLMPEALRAIFRYGFEEMGLHRVEANLAPDNVASRRVLEKLGFVREGLFRENWYHEGQFTDTATYGLLRRDFEAAQSAGDGGRSA